MQTPVILKTIPPLASREASADGYDDGRLPGNLRLAKSLLTNKLVAMQSFAIQDAWGLFPTKDIMAGEPRNVFYCVSSSIMVNVFVECF